MSFERMALFCENNVHVNSIYFVHFIFSGCLAESIKLMLFGKVLSERSVQFRSRVRMPRCDWSVCCDVVARSMNCVILSIVRPKSNRRMFDYSQKLLRLQSFLVGSLCFLFRVHRCTGSGGGLNILSTEYSYRRCIVHSHPNDLVGPTNLLVLRCTVCDPSCVSAVVATLEGLLIGLPFFRKHNI